VSGVPEEIRAGEGALLEEDEKKTDAPLTCEACRVSSLVFVSLSTMGAISFGILTDLEQGEAKRFYGSEAISSDDALQVYAFSQESRRGDKRVFRNEIVKTDIGQILIIIRAQVLTLFI